MIPVDLDHLNEVEREIIASVLERNQELEKQLQEQIKKISLKKDGSSLRKKLLLTGEWIYKLSKQKTRSRPSGSEVVKASLNDTDKSQDNAQRKYKDEKSPGDAKDENVSQKPNDEMRPKRKTSTRRSKMPSSTDRQVKFSENEAEKYVYEAQIYEDDNKAYKGKDKEVPTIIIDDLNQIKELTDEKAYPPVDNRDNASDSTLPGQVSPSKEGTSEPASGNTNNSFESYHSSVAKEMYSPSHDSEKKYQEEEFRKDLPVAKLVSSTNNGRNASESSSPTAKKVKVIRRKGSSRRKGQIMDDSTRDTLFRRGEENAGDEKDEKELETYKEPVIDEPKEDDQPSDIKKEKPTVESDETVMEHSDSEPVNTVPSTDNEVTISISPIPSVDPSTAVETNNYLSDSQNKESQPYADQQVHGSNSSIPDETKSEHLSSTYDEPPQADKEVSIPSYNSDEMEKEDKSMNLLHEITSSLDSFKDDVLLLPDSEQDSALPIDYAANASTEEHTQTATQEYVHVEDTTSAIESIYEKEHDIHVHTQDVPVSAESTIHVEDIQAYVDPDSKGNQIAYSSEILSEELHTQDNEEESKQDEVGTQDSPTTDKPKKKIIKKIVKKKVNVDEGNDDESTAKLVRKPTIRKKVVRKKLPE